jgi:prolyl 3-hydroxylase /prolyl 3,4-dihydroxylase
MERAYENGGRQDIERTKKLKRSKTNPPVLENLSSKELIETYRSFHDNAQPYPHAFLYPLANDVTMRTIYDEAKHNMTATFKETDLFKLFQTCDLANLSETDPLALKMPELMKLRTTLYSPEFRNFIQDMTGCDKLTDRVDCAANVYTNSCHLCCHDDVIGTRCVSYIIYLTDPDDQWNAADGGSLELYPLDHTASIPQDELLPNQGVPSTIPSSTILPLFNSMALFIVQPGRSYHSVQEVYCGDKPRLSIQGWYHAEHPPKGSNFASLAQILTKDELDSLPFTPLPAPDVVAEIYSSYPSTDHLVIPTPTPSTPTATPIATEITDFLPQADVDKLLQWMNPSYLTLKSIQQIQSQFKADSSIQLHNFLSAEISQLILDNLIEADELCQLGHSRPSMNYSVGETGHWKIKGPSHKQRYMVYSKPQPQTPRARRGNSSHQPQAPHQVTIDDANTVIGEILADLYKSFFNTPEFLRYLYLVTMIPLKESKHEIRRFRCGLDYLVANMSSLLSDQALLDVTMCFVNNKLKKYQRLWDSGDIGGYECYIEADKDIDSAATAEIYRVNEENPEEDTELLSIQGGFNRLNIVLRDTGVMKFIKFVSYRAPSSRWDLAMEYKIDERYFEDDGEEGGSEDEDSESDGEDQEDEDDEEEEDEDGDESA